jgi:hypothetical protein
MEGAPWPPWSSTGVDGVAKLLPCTHTNRMSRRLACGAKLNLAAVHCKGEDEVRSLILLASCFRFVSSLDPEASPPNADKPSYYLYSTSISSSFNSWSTVYSMDLGGVELSPSMAHTGLWLGLAWSTQDLGLIRLLEGRI